MESLGRMSEGIEDAVWRIWGCSLDDVVILSG